MGLKKETDRGPTPLYSEGTAPPTKHVKDKITESKNKLGRGIDSGTKMLETQIERKDAEKKGRSIRKSY